MREAMSVPDFDPRRLLVAGRSVLVLGLALLVLFWWLWKVFVSRRSSILYDESEHLLQGADASGSGAGETTGTPLQTGPLETNPATTLQSFREINVSETAQEASFPLGEVVIQIFGRRFAAGAMNEGTVEGVNGKVAVKQVLGRDCLEARAKLIKEVGYLTRCQSENVVQLIGYDYGVRQGTPQYSLKIATEWMSKNLEDVMGTCRMESRRFTKPELLHAAIGVATGMDVVHDMNIVHRNLKPFSVQIKPAVTPDQEGSLDNYINGIYKIAEFFDAFDLGDDHENTKARRSPVVDRYTAPEMISDDTAPEVISEDSRVEQYGREIDDHV